MATSRYPFGRPATRRPPRVPASLPADLFVLGVYPSALHVRWRRPDGKRVGALAVDDEPTVFWDGADAATRIEAWKAAVGWSAVWGTVALAGGNGSSGKHVVDHVLRPLGVAAEQTYFTDCLPAYVVKNGASSQQAAIDDVYAPFARDHGLPEADLPPRPTTTSLVATSVELEAAELRGQIAAAKAPTIVTLGQEAADVLACLAGVDRVALKPDGYGRDRPVEVADSSMRWWPLVHPGNRDAGWRKAHQAWVDSRA